MEWDEIISGVGRSSPSASGEDVARGETVVMPPVRLSSSSVPSRRDAKRRRRTLRRLDRVVALMASLAVLYVSAAVLLGWAMRLPPSVFAALVAAALVAGAASVVPSIVYRVREGRRPVVGADD